MANPATFQSIPALNPRSPRGPNAMETAFSVLAQGLKGYAGKKAADKDRRSKELMAVLPTMISKGMVIPSKTGGLQLGGQRFALGKAGKDWASEVNRLKTLGQLPISQKDRADLTMKAAVERAWMEMKPGQPADFGKIYKDTHKQLFGETAPQEFVEDAIDDYAIKEAIRRAEKEGKNVVVLNNGEVHIADEEWIKARQAGQKDIQQVYDGKKGRVNKIKEKVKQAEEKKKQIQKQMKQQGVTTPLPPIQQTPGTEFFSQVGRGMGDFGRSVGGAGAAMGESFMGNQAPGMFDPNAPALQKAAALPWYTLQEGTRALGRFGGMMPDYLRALGQGVTER